MSRLADSSRGRVDPRGEEIARRNRALVGKLGVIVVAMFGFGYALVPLYEKICEVTGLRDIDRADNNTIRRLYINPEAYAAAKSGQPFPDNTVLVLEMRSIQMADGKPVMKDGRFVPGENVVGIAVQQKKRGFGTEYAANLRNGDWEYAVFDINGTRRNAPTQACLQCHKPRDGEVLRHPKREQRGWWNRAEALAQGGRLRPAAHPAVRPRPPRSDGSGRPGSLPVALEEADVRLVGDERAVIGP